MSIVQTKRGRQNSSALSPREKAAPVSTQAAMSATNGSVGITGSLSFLSAIRQAEKSAAPQATISSR